MEAGSGLWVLVLAVDGLSAAAGGDGWGISSFVMESLSERAWDKLTMVRKAMCDVKVKGAVLKLI